MKIQMHFCVLRQSFCGKFKFSAGSGFQGSQLLECMPPPHYKLQPISANQQNFPFTFALSKHKFIPELFCEIEKRTESIWYIWLWHNQWTEEKADLKERKPYKKKSEEQLNEICDRVIKEPRLYLCKCTIQDLSMLPGHLKSIEIALTLAK